MNGQEGRAMKLALSLEQESFSGPGAVTAPNISITQRVTGPLDVAALSTAATMLLVRHEGLRFRTDVADPAAGQRIMPPDPVQLEPVPMSEARLWDRADHDYRTPLDLATEGPVRFCLYRMEAAAHVLTMTAHSAALDAWGVGVATRDLWAFYRAIRTGEGAGPAALPVSFSDHVRAQHSAGEQLTDAQRETHLAHYARLPQVRLPWRPGAAARGMRQHEAFGVSPGMLSGLSKTARNLQVTLAACFLAGFELALSLTAGCDDGALSCIYAGRDRPATFGMATAMARRVPIRFEIAPGTRLGEFIQQAMRGWAAAVGCSGPPYSAARLVRASAGPADCLEPVFNMRVPSQDRGADVPDDRSPDGVSSPEVEWLQSPRPRAVPMWPQFGRAALFALVTLGSQPAVAAICDPAVVPERTVRQVFSTYREVLRMQAEGSCSVPVSQLRSALGDVA
jgi:hypothetical protein